MTYKSTRCYSAEDQARILRALSQIERLTNLVREYSAIVPHEIATDAIYDAAGAVIAIRNILEMAQP